MANTYMLVHGAWHGGWCWDKVRTLLESCGHRVIAPDMPGHGGDKAPIAEQNLETYARAVEALLKDCDEPVILAGHSMGGAVISQAACYIPEKIKKLVYIAAFLLLDGQSCDGPDNGVKPTDWRKMAQSGNNIILSADEKTTELSLDFCTGWVFNDLPRDEALKIARLMGPEAIAAQYQSVSLNDTINAIPKAYIRCARDMSVPPEVQDKMLAATPCAEVYTMDTGHNPFASDPAGLAEILLKL